MSGPADQVAPTPAIMRPPRPRWVLLAALLLPGSGQVINGAPSRGLVFLFFIILLAWVSANVMPPQFSMIGRHIGGVFIYGMSFIDAYQTARVRWEKWRYAQSRCE